MESTESSPMPTTAIITTSTESYHHAGSPTRTSSPPRLSNQEQSSQSGSSPSRFKRLSRKPSGTIIIPRDDPRVEIAAGEETFDADDARAMSPRRSSQDVEKMSQDARKQLSQHAKILHDSLLEIFNRIDAVKQEHDKLDNNNKFLQKYIGDLMSTSKITATGASGRKK